MEVPKMTVTPITPPAWVKDDKYDIREVMESEIALHERLAHLHEAMRDTAAEMALHAGYLGLFKVSSDWAAYASSLDRDAKAEREEVAHISRGLAAVKTEELIEVTYQTHLWAQTEAMSAWVAHSLREMAGSPDPQ